MEVFNNVRVNNVEPLFNNKITISYWIYFSDITNLGTHVIHNYVKDLMISSVVSDGTQGIINYCSANSLFRDFSQEITGLNTKVPLVALIDGDDYTTKSEIANMQNRWIHLRCAFSLDQGKAYSLARHMETEDYEEKIILKDLLYNFSSTDHYNDRLFRQIYKRGENIFVEFKNFNLLSRKTYMKNFTLFREYIHKDVRLEY